MKLSLRLGVLSALATVAALAAMPASADLATGDNAELMLVVRNLDSPSAAYVRGLGININSIMTQAQTQGSYTGPVQAFSYTLPTFTADSNLTSFLSGGSTFGFTWSVMAADTVGSATSINIGNVATTGARRAVFAAGTDAPGFDNNAVNTASGPNAVNYYTSQNAALSGVAGSGDSSGAGTWGVPSSSGQDAVSFFGLVGIENAVSDTGSANFYLAAINAGAGQLLTSAARVFQFTDLRLAVNGTLSSVAPVSEVPLPAAFWLLGSGLLGALGIGRRRQAVAA